MPRLSIIVPVYKVEKYIHKCVDSILNQTFTDFELILVDDGSPDNCGKVCDDYAKQDSRVMVIHKENGGQSSARNRGLDVAKGDLIGFVDSDDTIDNDMYEQMICFLDNNELDIVCCDTYLVRGNREKIRLLFEENKLFCGNEGVEANLNGQIDNAVWNKVYKRHLFNDIRFVEGIVYEDVRIMHVLFSKANRIGYISKAFYHYYKRKNSTIANSFNSKSRYNCFVGYKERLFFAVDKGLDCVEVCRAQALSTALSTLTAFYANSEDEKSERYLDVIGFIKDNQKMPRSKFRRKDSILLWGINRCDLINKGYAFFSGLTKKF